MRNDTNNLLQTSTIYIRGWVVVGLLTFLLMVVGVNIGRVLVNASDNYQVYLAEQQGLEVLTSEYRELEKELLYYKSYDYKKLYARDQLNIVEPGQKLYRVTTPTEIYDVTDRRREIVKQDEYWEWWVAILFPGLR